MPTMTQPSTGEQTCTLVTGGVDTHQDTHTAVALDQTGRLLGHRQFPATAPGYASLLAWLRGFGLLVAAGIEGTGAYGAGLAAVLQAAGIELVEVDRPDRRTRRRQGKSDPVDAEAAARAAQARRATTGHVDNQIKLVRGFSQLQGLTNDHPQGLVREIAVKWFVVDLDFTRAGSQINSGRRRFASPRSVILIFSHSNLPLSCLRLF